MSTNQSVYNGIVPKNSEETRKRLLAAATKEFAQYGIAGARVDRIAEAAGANKQAIYAYFGSKESLFDAVYDAMVLQTMEEVPIDAYDLPDTSVVLRPLPQTPRSAPNRNVVRDGTRQRHSAPKLFTLLEGEDR